MSKIVDIDKNLKVDAEIDKTGLKFYDANSEPFKIPKFVNFCIR